jgi:hypothetical protein
MQRSLNNKRCPYDDTVAEATFKTVKTEFVSNTIFDSLNSLGCNLITMWIGLMITGFVCL